MSESTEAGGFGFTESQEMYRRAVREFAERELAPAAKQRNKRDVASAQEIKGLMKKLYDSGLFGLELPERFGGHPSDWTTYAIATEEMAKVDDLMAAWYSSSRYKLAILLRGAGEHLLDEFVRPLALGEKIVAGCITEPGCGSDVAAIQTRAVRDGDYYVLNGEKTSISWGTQADFLVVFAKTDPAARARGVSSFVVPVDLPGINRSLLPDIGWRQIGRTSIIFDNVRVPKKYLLGEENKAFYSIMGSFDAARLFLSLQVLALAQVALDHAITYAKERKAFGRPIAQFEAISFKIAEYLTLIEAGRLLCYRAFWLGDRGLHHAKESAMAKWFCPKIAVEAIHAAMLIHGHVGYSEEYPIEKLLRDAIAFEIADGTADIQKVVIAREVLGKEFRPY